MQAGYEANAWLVGAAVRGGIPLSGMSEEGAGTARRPTRAASIAAEGEKRSVFRVRDAAPTSQRIPREERRPDLEAYSA